MTSIINDDKDYIGGKCINHHIQIADPNTQYMSCQSRTYNSLKPWNAFQLESFASRISIVENVATLSKYWLQSYDQGQPTLLLGEGSNVLFLENFCGHVIINRIKGIQIKEEADDWLLHVGAGENWHQLIKYMLQNGIPGLENLALIPGCVGSAPIQNIGAYGVDLAKFCEYVDVFCLTENKMRRLMAKECEFSYRDSVFKHRMRKGYGIVAVGLRLPKAWRPVLTYGLLKKLDPSTVTPQQVFDLVCLIRREKLPDEKVIGNAGSFFKNPFVSAEQAARLKLKFPNLPLYSEENGQMKLAAGWLIEQCGLKGFRVGGAAVYDKQALVLVNADAATGRDIIELAQVVRQRVADKFSVSLEPEVRFIAAHGEIDAVKVFQ